MSEKKQKQRFVNSLFVDDTVYNVEDPIQSAMYSVEIILNAAIRSFEIAQNKSKAEVSKMLLTPEELAKNHGKKRAELRDKRIANFKVGVNNHFLNAMKFLKMVDVDQKKYEPKSNIQAITPKIIT